MILQNVHIVGDEAAVNIQMSDGKIAEISDTVLTDDNLTLTFKDALIFPGLINSHDHLDFNLFSPLGNRTYRNYTEWGNYIHKEYKNEIAGVLKIPIALRSEWGVYKNLICGVTTVVNHGERSRLVDPLITIFEDSHCLHSVHFEKYWKLKLNNPLKKDIPVNIHIGEGDDYLSFTEINKLIQYNLLKRGLIGIHAVSMSAEQAEKFEAIVWCPESNYFLLNKTARVDELEKHTKILFGTDSTLTGSWDIWEHLRLARKTGMLTDEKLYRSLNQNPADTWGLNSGSITLGKNADLVVAGRRPGKSSYDAFYKITPEDIQLVVHKGEIRLFDECLLPQLHENQSEGYSRVFLNDTCKYVKGDLPVLIRKIRAYQPDVCFPVTLNEPAQL
ncbi:amidohydrolase family protein [Mucilaginibacter sp. BJC16-A38]|uniref:amidohydrolase family protein n=1 Tax=Mucilaginibacter phenanthrenivorans TaxID=1234842 RepID=UPI00215776B2|nr:amidohydrolase family protein [Mucilaginibacter phenanthrenivorans]MCR8559977.1 amidohydrolase family protein [Mucilaginibacter phenanthrenivorans]